MNNRHGFISGQDLMDLLSATLVSVSNFVQSPAGGEDYAGDAQIDATWVRERRGREHEVQTAALRNGSVLTWHPRTLADPAHFSLGG
jgi:hypothetical protein